MSASTLNHPLKQGKPFSWLSFLLFTAVSLFLLLFVPLYTQTRTYEQETVASGTFAAEIADNVAQTVEAVTLADGAPLTLEALAPNLVLTCDVASVFGEAETAVSPTNCPADERMLFLRHPEKGNLVYGAVKTATLWHGETAQYSLQPDFTTAQQTLSDSYQAGQLAAPASIVEERQSTIIVPIHDGEAAIGALLLEIDPPNWNLFDPLYWREGLLVFLPAALLIGFLLAKLQQMIRGNAS